MKIRGVLPVWVAVCCFSAGPSFGAPAKGSRTGGSGKEQSLKNFERRRENNLRSTRVEDNNPNSTHVGDSLKSIHVESKSPRVDDNSKSTHDDKSPKPALAEPNRQARPRNMSEVYVPERLPVTHRMADHLISQYGAKPLENAVLLFA